MVLQKTKNIAVRRNLIFTKNTVYNLGYYDKSDKLEAIEILVHSNSMRM